jgi:PIN domain nuclease of toxin-antitoxin system
MNRLSLLVVSVLLAGGFAFAHGGEQHVMGTVSKVTQSTITVTTTDGKSVEVALTPQTIVTKQDKTIGVKEIKEGDRAVIHAKKNGENLEATRVQIGSAK